MLGSDARVPARGCAACARVRGALASLPALGGAVLRRWVWRVRGMAASLRVARERTGWRPGKTSHYVFRGAAHPGSRMRHYAVHVPRGYTGRREVPLVVVLHGCRQTHEDIREISAFDRVADRAGFLVVYPFVTSYAGLRNPNCWGWWRDEETRPGAGEVEDLWHVVEEVRGRFRVDTRRIHVAGLSSGAGMAVTMMVCHADRVASGAAVAGVPFAETAGAVSFSRHAPGQFRPVERVARDMDGVMGPRKRVVPLMVVHSHGDETVNIQAAHNLRDSWGACFGLAMGRGAVHRSGITAGTSWVHTRYRQPDGRAPLETLFLEGVGHGWCGGVPGRFSYPDGPDVSAMLWDFFRANPRRRPWARRWGPARAREA